jgi:hypothetical protein
VLGDFPLSDFKDRVDSLVHALSYIARPVEFEQQALTQVMIYDPLAAHREELFLDTLADIRREGEDW